MFIYLYIAIHWYIIYFYRYTRVHSVVGDEQTTNAWARGSSINESSHWLATDIAISSISHPNTHPKERPGKQPALGTYRSIRFFIFIFFSYSLNIVRPSPPPSRPWPTYYIIIRFVSIVFFSFVFVLFYVISHCYN